MSSKMMVFSGNANPELAGKVASRLYLTLGKADVGKFSDGEIAVELNENVRGKDVFVVQSTCAPTNDNLMELLVMIDALRRASAHELPRSCPTSATPARIAGCDLAGTHHRQGGGRYDGAVGVDRVLTWTCMRSRSRASSPARWTTSTAHRY